MKRIITALLALISLTAAGQKKDALSLELSGGVKRTIFHIAHRQIYAFNATSSYDEGQIRPEVSNTLSFFAILKSRKPVSDRWSLTNTLGLDMQQLSIVSGFRKDPGTSSGITSYSQTYYNELLPRLKVDFGLNYQLFSIKDGHLSLGARAGQMIALSSAGNTYSFLESGLGYTGKRISLTLSGSLTPYNVQLKNMENLIGNKGAESIRAYYAHRIYEIGLGLSYGL